MEHVDDRYCDLSTGKLYETAAKSQLKKVIKIWQQEIRKAMEKAKRESEAQEATSKRADEARQVRYIHVVEKTFLKLI